MSVQTIERRGERARLASWRGDRQVAHLCPAVGRPLTPVFIASCLDWLRERGYGSVVTSALTATECPGFFQSGFDVREELDLLEHDLDRLPPVPPGLRKARRWDRAAVVRLDARAFPPFWRLHHGGLAEALSATPSVRFRLAGRRPDLAGYAIAGRGAATGYLQRLAVDPVARGRGLGQGLVADALVWMRRHGAARALVNTQRTNEGARALYQACGFRVLPEGLAVLECRL